MLAALVWRPNWRRYIILVIVEIFAVVAVFRAMPMFKTGSPSVVNSLPTGPHSDYYRVMGAGPEVFETHLFLALGQPPS